MKLKCSKCGAEFVRQRRCTKQRFCTPKCYTSWFNESRRRPETERVCKRCGVRFVSTGANTGGKKFCSTKCCQRFYDKVVYKNAMANGKFRARANLKYKTNHRHRMRVGVSSAVNNALKNRGAIKKGSTWDSLPYSPMDLVQHLQSFFTSENGFTWDNYGSVWHVDHVVPQSWFQFENMIDEGFQNCWALSNLQPMKKSENLAKNNRFIGRFDSDGQIVFV